MAFKVPYDSTVLAAVAHECRGFVGGRLQKVSQPDDHTVVLQTYGAHKARMLLLSCDAGFPRVHLTSVRPQNPQPPPAFCAVARHWTEGGRIASVEQRGFDRILEITVTGSGGEAYRYVVELMGKHSNVILLGPDEMILGAVKTVGPRQSRRRVRAGLRYEQPPTAGGRPNPLDLDVEQFEALLRDSEAAGPEWLAATFEGIGPFLAEQLWLAAGESRAKLSEAFGAWRDAVMAQEWTPASFRDAAGSSLGAYPLPIIAPEAVTASPRGGISQALEVHYLKAVPQAREHAARTHLQSVLTRARKSLDRAQADVEKGLAESDRAPRHQLFGELILAYGHDLPQKADRLTAPDYTDARQAEVEIPLDPGLTPVENAERYFRRARKGKKARDSLAERLGTLKEERAEVGRLLAALPDAEAEELEAARERALARGWMARQEVAQEKGAERPWGRHRIREVRTPDGVLILYGENAEANDYLSQRVAKPSDWWIHVRGGVSAHAIIPTNNRPERIPKPAIEEAARIVARHSPGKHSSVVAVDYTLRKYVRKPRNAPPGTMLYTHEKTLHVSPTD
jgi:predicted ribosome quality control (RQC) complex YloA/Tae2 family protein